MLRPLWITSIAQPLVKQRGQLGIDHWIEQLLLVADDRDAILNRREDTVFLSAYIVERRIFLSFMQDDVAQPVCALFSIYSAEEGQRHISLSILRDRGHRPRFIQRRHAGIDHSVWRAFLHGNSADHPFVQRRLHIITHISLAFQLRQLRKEQHCRGRRIALRRADAQRTIRIRISADQF